MLPKIRKFEPFQVAAGENSQYLVKVPPSGLQSLHEAVEDESRIPPGDAAVRRPIAHVLLLVRAHIRAHLPPLLLVLLLQPVPDDPLPAVAAHEQDPHLVDPIREREVHLLGASGVADRDLARDGDTVLAVGERVPVVVDVVVGVLVGGPAEEAEVVGRAEGGKAREGKLPRAAAPGGGAVEEEVAEEVAVAGGRRRVDANVVKAVRGREARPADLDLVAGAGRGKGGARRRPAGSDGRDGEEEEETEVGVFGGRLTGDAVEKLLVTCPEQFR